MPHLICIKFSHNSFAYSKHLGSHRLNLKAGAEGRAEPSTLETHSKARTARLVHSPCRSHVSFSKVTGDTLQLEKPFYISNSIFSDWKPDTVCFFGRMISFSFMLHSFSTREPDLRLFSSTIDLHFSVLRNKSRSISIAKHLTTVTVTSW